MRTLVVEDDFTSRLLLQEILKGYGDVHVAVNGKEAVAAVSATMDAGEPYDLICLDIMMPEMDGYQALDEIRRLEKEQGILPPGGAKIVMTTALHQMKNIAEAFYGLCDGYLYKPIDKGKLLKQLRELKLVA